MTAPTADTTDSPKPAPSEEAEWLRRERRRNTVMAFIVAPVLTGCLLVAALFLVDQINGGPSERAQVRSNTRILEGQHEAKAATECRSAYASAEAAAATKYRHAQTVLVMAVAEVGPTTVPIAVKLLRVADREQVRFTRLRLRSNDLCDPPGDAEPIMPPHIDPPVAAVPTG